MGIVAQSNQSTYDCQSVHSFLEVKLDGFFSHKLLGLLDLIHVNFEFLLQSKSEIEVYVVLECLLLLLKLTDFLLQTGEVGYAIYVLWKIAVEEVEGRLCINLKLFGKQH